MPSHVKKLKGKGITTHSKVLKEVFGVVWTFMAIAKERVKEAFPKEQRKCKWIAKDQVQGIRFNVYACVYKWGTRIEPS